MATFRHTSNQVVPVGEASWKTPAPQPPSAIEKSIVNFVNPKLKKFRGAVKIAIAVALLTLVLTGVLAYILYKYSCEWNDYTIAVPFLYQLGGGAVCDFIEVKSFIIGDAAATSYGVFGKQSYMFNYTNNGKGWQAMADSLNSYDPTDTASFDNVLSQPTFNLTVSTLAHPNDTDLKYELIFLKKRVPKTFSTAAYVAKINKLISGHPDSAYLEDDDGNYEYSDSNTSDSQADSTSSGARRRFLQAADNQTSQWTITFAATNFTSKQIEIGESSVKPSNDPTAPVNLMTREVCTWTVNEAAWTYFLINDDLIPNRNVYDENALNLQPPECCVYVGNNTEFWCATLEVQTKTLAKIGDGVAFYYRQLSDPSTPAFDMITDDLTKNQVVLEIATRYLNQTIIQWVKQLQGRMRAEMRVSLLSASVSCQVYECSRIEGIVGESLGYSMYVEMGVTVLVLGLVLMIYIIFKTGGNAARDKSTLRQLFKEAFQELVSAAGGGAEDDSKGEGEEDGSNKQQHQTAEHPSGKPMHTRKDSSADMEQTYEDKEHKASYATRNSASDIENGFPTQQEDTASQTPGTKATSSPVLPAIQLHSSSARLTGAAGAFDSPMAAHGGPLAPSKGL